VTDEPPASVDPSADRPGTGDARRQRRDAVRRAVDHAVSATQDGISGARSTGVRAQSAVLEELGGALTRMRAAFDELGTAGSAQAGALVDEVQQAVGRLTRSTDGPDLGARLEALEARVAALEAERPAGLDGGPPQAV